MAVITQRQPILNKRRLKKLQSLSQTSTMDQSYSDATLKRREHNVYRYEQRYLYR